MEITKKLAEAILDILEQNKFRITKEMLMGRLLLLTKMGLELLQ
jgi:hypothetical protein